MNLLNPVRTFDLGQLYAEIGPLLDFVLFAVLFSSLAYVTIGRRFQHRGLSVSVGLILAVALATGEKALGFTVQSLGSVAAGVVVLMVGAFLFGLLRTLGMGASLAGVAAYLGIYTGLALYSPGMIDWLSEEAPILALLAAAVFVMGIIILGWSGYTHVASAFPQLQEALSRGTDVVRRQVKRSTDSLRQLDRQAVRQPKTAMRMASEVLPDLRNRQSRLHQQLRRLRGLVEGIERQDIRVVRRLQDLKPEQRQAAQAEILRSVERLRAAQQLKRLEQVTEACERHVDHHLQRAMTAAGAGDEGAFRIALQQCVKGENASARQLERMQNLERELREIVT